MSEHLALPFYEREFKRKKRPAPSSLRPHDNRKEFSEIQIFKLGEIKDEFKHEREKVRRFIDPKLIFKVELNQKVNEEGFINFLRRSGISVISPSPTGTGYWVLLAEDEELTDLHRRLSLYGEEEKYKEFDAIQSFDSIPAPEKIGEQLKLLPLGEDEEAYLDVEIWRMDNNRIQTFLNGFREMLLSRDSSITDEIKTENLCIIRIKTNRSTLDEIIELREISYIDRPPKPYLDLSLLSVPYEDFKIKAPPSEDSTAIAIMDSGILSNHPLLGEAVGDEIAIATNNGRISSDRPSDDVGHGTKIAGVAIYGDLKSCIDSNTFEPGVWLLSAKIMYAETNPTSGEIEAKYDESELLEHQLEKAVRWAVNIKRNCRIVNISFGNTYKKMFGNKRQFPLSTLIDDLAKELDIVFVVSAGNIVKDFLDINYPDNYPNYLLEDIEDVKIIDPASSAYAITVGSITQLYGPVNLHNGDLPFSPANTNFPSPFTCVGPGYKSMIKPELVEEGGNIILTPSDPARMENAGGKLIVLNPNWISDGKLFTLDCGTSLSAPKVAYYFGRLFNAFPDRTSNLIKAILISASDIPSDRPEILSNINYTDSSDNELIKLLNIYGYGKPNIDFALSSELNRVLLLAENSIKLDAVQLYYLYLPSEFIETSGDKQISATLVYNPPVKRSSIDYVGVHMEYHLFQGSTIDELQSAYSSIDISQETEDIVPTELIIKEIKLKPGVRTRVRGIHQKGVKNYVGTPRIETNQPLILAVISKNRWLGTTEPDYTQDYSVVVTIKHKAEIDLYNLIQQQVTIPTRVRVRTN